MCTCQDGKLYGCVSNWGEKCNRNGGRKIPRFKYKKDKLMILEEPGFVPDLRGYERGF